MIAAPSPGIPPNLLNCLQYEETAASEQDVTRLSMASSDQPTGPAIFMSEFGATDSVPLAGFDVEWAGSSTVGWIYWAWKYYDDPTGSSAEGLVLPNGSYTPIVTVLSRTYPQEVAGVAIAVLFNPFTSAFSMAYTPSVSARGQTDHRGRRVTALPERLVRRGEGRQDRLTARAPRICGCRGWGRRPRYTSR